MVQPVQEVRLPAHANLKVEVEYTQTIEERCAWSYYSSRNGPGGMRAGLPLAVGEVYQGIAGRSEAGGGVSFDEVLLLLRTHRSSRCRRRRNLLLWFSVGSSFKFVLLVSAHESL